MDYFWKENKKFVMLVGGGVLFALLFNGFVLSPLRRAGDAAARNRLSEKKVLEKRMAQGVPGEDTLRAARNQRDRNRQLVASLAGEVGFKVADKFKKPDREARGYFDNVRLDTLKELQEKAQRARIAFPSNLGFGDDCPEDQAAEYLFRLATVERLASTAIESEVEKIEVIDGLAGGTSRDEPATRKPVFLARYPVFMRFAGKAEAVFKVLHGVQKKGTYLAVTHFEARRTDSTKDLLEASISVAYLKVDPQASVEVRP